MYHFKFLGNEAHFHSNHDKRILKSPKGYKKQISNNRYFFEKPTCLKYDIDCLIISESFINTDDRVASRIWNSLWTEGWR